MGVNKILKLLLYTGSMISLVLFTACLDDGGGGTGPKGSITNCCQDLGRLNTDGLIAYYSMDDLPESIPVGFEIKDRSGNGNHGIFKRDKINFAADSAKESEVKDGIIGKALRIAKWDYIAILDGKTDEDFEFGTSDFTWSMWVEPTEDGPHNNNRNQIWFGAQLGEAGCGGGTHMWLGKDAVTDLILWQLRTVHKHEDSLYVQGQYQHTALKSEGYADKWIHVVAVKDGHEYSNISIYINGKEVKEYEAQTGVGNETVSKDYKVRMDKNHIFSKIDYFYLGMFPVCNGYASTFTMDEVSIWNRPLSKDEVEMLYKTQKP
jgi:hypothetical protein